MNSASMVQKQGLSQTISQAKAVPSALCVYGGNGKFLKVTVYQNECFIYLKSQYKCFNNYLLQVNTINFKQIMQQFHSIDETQSNESFNLDQISSIDSDDDDYSLKRKYYIKKNKNKIRKSKKGGIQRNHNQSLWNISENTAYMHFLMEKGHLFDSNSIQRKAIKINVQMSQVIKTRSPDQCRSHHQKMMKHHKDIPQIIEHIRMLLRNHEKPPQVKPLQCESMTDACISLKDLSNFEAMSDDEESIWSRLIKNLSSESSEADVEWR